MINGTGQVFIKNISPTHFRYVICRLVDGDLWYFSTWKTREAAEFAAEELENALVVDMGEPTWVPTADAIPDKNDEYLITWRGRLGEQTNVRAIEIAEYSDEWILDHITNRGYKDVQVVAWQNTLEPYKGGTS